MMGLKYSERQWMTLKNNYCCNAKRHFLGTHTHKQFFQWYTNETLIKYLLSKKKKKTLNAFESHTGIITKMLKQFIQLEN